MTKIVFDGFDPNEACLQPPPVKLQAPDGCRVEAQFHIRGDLTPENPVITFRRSQEKFVLDASQGRESTLGLLQGFGLTEADPNLQSALLYSVSLHRWMRTIYPSFLKDHPTQDPPPFPLADRLRNFIVTGSIQDPDPTQNKERAALLKEIFHTQSEVRTFFLETLESLNTEGGKKGNLGLILPFMRSRIQWLAELAQVYKGIHRTFSSLKDTIIQDAIHQQVVSLLIYLGTGEGDWKKSKADLDKLIPALKNQPDLPADWKEPYSLLLSQIRHLEKSQSFTQGPQEKRNLKEVISGLEQAAKSHRPELFKVSTEKPKKRLVTFTNLGLPLLGVAATGGLILGLSIGLTQSHPLPMRGEDDRNPVMGFGP